MSHNYAALAVLKKGIGGSYLLFYLELASNAPIVLPPQFLAYLFPYQVLLVQFLSRFSRLARLSKGVGLYLKGPVQVGPPPPYMSLTRYLYREYSEADRPLLHRSPFYPWEVELPLFLRPGRPEGVVAQRFRGFPLRGVSRLTQGYLQ